MPPTTGGSRFPASSARSPLLEIRATDTLEQLTGSVTLRVSGKVVSVETWKPTGAATDLAVQVNAIKSLLTANEHDYGGYLHDERFVAFFNRGGIEYEGGTTTSGGALAHETFHTDPPVVVCSRDPWQRHTPTTRMTAAGPALTRCAG